MKRYYSITILAIIVITLLQGYNISLQYKNYLHYKIEKINSVFKVAIDEEYANRAHKNYKPHKDGKQRFYYKNMTEEDLLVTTQHPLKNKFLRVPYRISYRGTSLLEFH